jgi:hypothetical protein
MGQNQGLDQRSDQGAQGGLIFVGYVQLYDEEAIATDIGIAGIVSSIDGVWLTKVEDCVAKTCWLF